jgi:hypothetical protein
LVLDGLEVEGTRCTGKTSADFKSKQDAGGLIFCE